MQFRNCLYRFTVSGFMIRPVIRFISSSAPVPDGYFSSP
ncbi:hypothetical protein X965_19870 [Morganella sp. EGD-HP17]|nr:hypothetical protein X965_19870 [Morganella sp. EGD-HP17]